MYSWYDVIISLDSTYKWKDTKSLEVIKHGTNGIGPGKEFNDNRFAVYTQWGSTNCTTSNTLLIYSGYTSVSPSSDKGGGSNYLCLPEKPTYMKKHPSRSSISAQIDGAKYGSTFSKVNSNMQRKVIQCSVCQIEQRTTTLMLPASNECPKDYVVLYTGYLSTQVSLSRTQFICIDNSTVPTILASNTRIQVSELELTIVSECNILPCGKEKYIQNALISCIVCAK